MLIIMKMFRTLRKCLAYIAIIMKFSSLEVFGSRCVWKCSNMLLMNKTGKHYNILVC